MWKDWLAIRAAGRITANLTELARIVDPGGRRGDGDAMIFLIDDAVEHGLACPLRSGKGEIDARFSVVGRALIDGLVWRG